MSKEYLNHVDCRNAEELSDAIQGLIESVDAGHASAIYLTSALRLTMEVETLTDGSEVFNVRVSLIA